MKLGTTGWLIGFLGLALLGATPLAFEIAMAEPDCAPVEQRILPTETDRAARLSDAILRSSVDADCELARRGMSRADYIELMDDIAADRRLATAYAAEGVTVHTHTAPQAPPNVVFLGLYDKLYEAGPRLSFSQWIFAFLPLSLLGLPVAWLLLTRVFYPSGRATPARDGSEGLPTQDGPMTVDQARVLAVFVITALLWVFRADVKLGFVSLPGWSNLLGGARGMVTDGTVAVVAASSLFLLPSRERSDARTLLRWRDSRDVPWGILLLFGGGFAIAHAFKETGVSQAIGGTLHQLEGIPIFLLMLVVALAVTHLTEITSNTATTTVLVPIAAAAAIPLDVHPLVVMLPVTLAASCAFMLPVATPPNAIVFGSGRLRMGHMMRAGIVLNIASALLVLGAVTALAPKILGFEPTELPEWAVEEAAGGSAHEGPHQEAEDQQQRDHAPQ